MLEALQSCDKTDYLMWQSNLSNKAQNALGAEKPDVHELKH